MKRALALSAAIAAVLLLLPASGLANDLCRQLRGRLVRGGGASSGFFVVDAGTGAAVCGRAARQRRPLASNMKLFTTSTALVRFGPHYRIATSLLTDGAVDATGVLHGSLYLKGGGDPALGDPVFYDRFLGGLGTNLFDLTGQLHEAGVRVVTGRLYADDTIFDRLRGVADSGYATSSYIGPLSGLSFDSGYSSTSATGFSSDPAKLAATELAVALRQSGIRVQPRVALEATPALAQPLATVESPTLSQLVAATDVYSNNFFAEMLLKLIGARLGGSGTTRTGAGVVERFARSHGSGVHAVDGSGLTHTNRASPTEVVRLLQAMRGTAVGEEFIQDLAVAGHDGTVATRMHGTAADGNCHTKTGTLTGVSNLSGYCFNPDGKTMIFSILMGGVRNLALAHYEQDRIAAAIASY
ncbi:MAG: D-alanyl-D-alanine carboxypeptidase/D-alanyl-D-alanine-endopeptidase [Solirubrobacterales bacterium]